MVGHGDAVHAAGTSPSDAAAPGTVVAGIVECGDGYTSHELYDVKLTLLELLRGEAAGQRLAGATPAPGVGQEYILVRIKFEYYARGRPGDCEHAVKPEHFTAWSSNGTAYTAPTVAMPEPSLRGLLHSEQSLEGWIAVQVAPDDAKPLLTFSVDDTGAVQHGGKLWFQLYH
ncbi:MAG: hypothetical protein HW386_1319 [Gammaproteobacteria bacterium]|nr:hypothetical protein [Gammaproteobacteria bacterium]